MVAQPIPPTRAQLLVLHAIRDLTEADGRPPTYREIAAELDYADAGRVCDICTGLRERGWLEHRAPGKARSLFLAHQPPPLPEPVIEVTDDGRQYLSERNQA